MREMICPRCGAGYTERPAMSRVNNVPICPMCGHREALDEAVGHGIMSRKEADDIITKIREAYRGRTE